MHIVIYSFVFSYIFQVRAPEEFGQTRFVVFDDRLSALVRVRRCGRQIHRPAGEGATDYESNVSAGAAGGQHNSTYLTHVISFGLLLGYLTTQGLFSAAWLLIPMIFALQFLFTLGLVAALSACVCLRDLQHIMLLGVTIWFLTPVIYPISMIRDERVRDLFLLNPMHNFINLYREIVLLGEVSLTRLTILVPTALVSYCAGGWLFMRIRHAFGDVL